MPRTQPSAQTVSKVVQRNLQYGQHEHQAPILLTLDHIIRQNSNPLSRRRNAEVDSRFWKVRDWYPSNDLFTLVMPRAAAPCDLRRAQLRRQSLVIWHIHHRFRRFFMGVTSYSCRCTTFTPCCCMNSTNCVRISSVQRCP